MPTKLTTRPAVLALGSLLSATLLQAQPNPPWRPDRGPATAPVTVKNFARAESDMYFAKVVKRGGFGKFDHNRDLAPVDNQVVVRMNRDTVYSGAVFDLDAAPATITLPDSGKRFMSLMIINEDAYSPEVTYAPGRYSFTKEQIGTRYMMAVIRTVVNPADPKDIQTVNKLQDAIKVEQANTGKFEIPNWDPVSQKKLRDALLVLASMQGTDPPSKYGWKGEVDPVYHLIGGASGWGGNPPAAAKYVNFYPKANDGRTVHKLTVKDVPVDSFWSISVYNKDGYYEKNEQGTYSINNLTAKPNADGSVTVQFGGDPKGASNYLAIMPGWNYTARMFRPRREIIDGTWKFPEAQPVK